MRPKLPENSELLFSAKEIDLIVDKLAQEIGAEILKSDGPVLFIGILKGAWIFLGDLVRRIPHGVEVEFLRASSYGGAQKSSGRVKVELPEALSVAGKSVYLVDEIIDTGRTLLDLREVLLSKGAARVRLVALLDKRERREVDIEADFVGLQIPDDFVIGYGLDWNERFRDLPDIYVIKGS